MIHIAICEFHYEGKSLSYTFSFATRFIRFCLVIFRSIYLGLGDVISVFLGGDSDVQLNSAIGDGGASTILEKER